MQCAAPVVLVFMPDDPVYRLGCFLFVYDLYSSNLHRFLLTFQSYGPFY
jgi:hypothetical protein